MLEPWTDRLVSVPFFLELDLGMGLTVYVFRFLCVCCVCCVCVKNRANCDVPYSNEKGDEGDGCNDNHKHPTR